MERLEYTDIEREVLRLLKECPRSAKAVAKLINMEKLATYNIIKRLKSHGRAYYHNGRWHWLPEQVAADTSPFPAPKYATKCVGWWG